MEKSDVQLYNRKSWNRQVEKGSIWTRPVDEAVVATARKGEWSIVMSPTKTVPREWFPEDITDKRVLCLACGGGQQGPILAAAGACVTVLDNSPKQLEQDAAVARREGLNIKTILGDMRDLSCFSESDFDLVLLQGTVFVESILPVWQETARVLRPGGILLSGISNPIAYIFDLKSWNEGRLVVRHRIPYSDVRDLDADEFQTLIVDHDEPICFGHSMHDLIQGQIDAGFVVSGFYEDKESDGPLDRYIDSHIVTRSIRIQSKVLERIAEQRHATDG